MTPSDGPDSRSPQERVVSATHAAKGAILAGLAVGLGYLFLRSAPQWAPGAFADDGVYLAVGRSLAEGEGYRSAHAAGAPLHLKYPPGLPWLYSILWSLGGTLARVHAWATHVSLLASATSAGVMWYIGRRALGVGPVWLALGMIGPFFLEGTIQYLNLPLSEPLFLLLVVLACAAFPGALRGEVAGALAVAACLSAAVLVRTQGLVLLAAVGLAYPWRSGRWRFGLVMIGAPLLTSVWWRWRLRGWQTAEAAGASAAALEPDELAYGSVLIDSGAGGAVAALLETIRTTSRSYLDLASGHLASVGWLGSVLFLAFLSAAVAGGVRSRRRAPLLVWSVATLTGVLLVWPYAQDRFLLTLFPLWGLLAVGGLPSGVQSLRSKWGRVAVACAAGAVLLSGSRQVQVRSAVTMAASETTPYAHPAWFLRENTRYLATTADWLNEHAAASDRVLAPLSAGVFLLSGLQATNATPFEAIGRPLFAIEGRYLAERIRDQEVTLLVLWGSTYPITRDGAALQRECPDALAFQGTTGAPVQAAVFRIRSQDPCLRDWIDRVTG